MSFIQEHLLSAYTINLSAVHKKGSKLLVLITAIIKQMKTILFSKFTTAIAFKKIQQKLHSNYTQCKQYPQDKNKVASVRAGGRSSLGKKVVFQCVF